MEIFYLFAALVGLALMAKTNAAPVTAKQEALAKWDAFQADKAERMNG